MNHFSPLPRSFYEPSARIVAPRLLGHRLVRHTTAGPVGGPIVEVEAYLKNDPACHGAPGLTARNRVMFGPAGFGYVYLIYGLHFCVNAVCHSEGVAEAVLIRALEPAFGGLFMQERRPGTTSNLTNGPAKLCAALGITRRLDGVDLCDPHGELFIAENPEWKKFRRQHGPVVRTPRIGITKAAERPLRFYLEKSAFVSRRNISQEPT